MELDSSCGCSSYNFCPIGGIVCSRCHYPVRPLQRCYVLGIIEHERKSKVHEKMKLKSLSRVEAKEIVECFYGEMKEIAMSLIDNMHDNMTATPGVLQKYLNKVNDCCYCSLCQTIVYDKTIHLRGKHKKFVLIVNKDINQNFGMLRTQK
jgi:hypothetical protein